MPTAIANAAGVAKRNTVARERLHAPRARRSAPGRGRTSGRRSRRTTARLRCRGRNGYSIGASPSPSTMNAPNRHFVVKSFETRCMLRRIWRPSATIRGTAPKSPRTSTRSETVRAIWAPLPCAIAMRDALSAGTSFTPSPIIADVAAVVAQRLDDALLPVGRDASDDGRLPQHAREAPRRPPGSSLPFAGVPTPAIPASVAMVATVDGASPERTLRAMSWSSKYETVSRVFGRSSSESVARPRSSRPDGRPAAGSMPSSSAFVDAIATTRRPEAASSRASSAASPRGNNSGAPRT